MNGMYVILEMGLFIDKNDQRDKSGFDSTS